jgi:hypothetical protein
VREYSVRNCSGDRFGASSKVPCWKLRVGKVPKRLNVSRFAPVPSSRYFAVAGPKDRFDRSRLNSVNSRGCAHSTRCVPRTAIALMFLLPSTGPAAAATGVASVVRDRRVEDGALARWPD